jgi:hypothetical protein
VKSHATPKSDAWSDTCRNGWDRAFQHLEPSRPSEQRIIPDKKSVGGAAEIPARKDEALDRKDERKGAPVPRVVATQIDPEPTKGQTPVSELPGLGVGEVFLTGALTKAGNTTAISAVETFIWAAINGREEAGAELIAWTWREKAHEFFGQMPAEYRLKYTTPESLLFAMHQQQTSAAGGVEILKREVLGPNDEVFRIRFLNGDGTAIEEQFLMRRTVTGWKKEEPPTRIGSMFYRLRGEEPPWEGK